MHGLYGMNEVVHACVTLSVCVVCVPTLVYFLDKSATGVR